MMSDEIYLRLNELKKKYPFMYSKPATEEELMILESYSGWRIPEECIEFLRFSSGAVVGAYPIYGVNPNELMGKNRNTIISATTDFRLDGWSFGEEFIVISENHAGDPVLLNKDGFVLMQSHDGFEENNWKNFLDFLKWCLK